MSRPAAPLPPQDYADEYEYEDEHAAWPEDEFDDDEEVYENHGERNAAVVDEPEPPAALTIEPPGPPPLPPRAGALPMPPSLLPVAISNVASTVTQLKAAKASRPLPGLPPPTATNGPDNRDGSRSPCPPPPPAFESATEDMDYLSPDEEEEIQQRRQNKLSNVGHSSSPASRVPMPPNTSLKNVKVSDVKPKTKPVPKPVVQVVSEEEEEEEEDDINYEIPDRPSVPPQRNAPAPLRKVPAVPSQASGSGPTELSRGNAPAPPRHGNRELPAPPKNVTNVFPSGEKGPSSKKLPLPPSRVAPVVTDAYEADLYEAGDSDDTDSTFNGKIQSPFNQIPDLQSKENVKKKPLPPAPICKEPVNNLVDDDLVYETEEEHQTAASALKFPSSLNNKPDVQSRAGDKALKKPLPPVPKGDVNISATTDAIYEIEDEPSVQVTPTRGPKPDIQSRFAASKNCSLPPTPNNSDVAVKPSKLLASEKPQAAKALSQLQDIKSRLKPTDGSEREKIKPVPPCPGSKPNESNKPSFQGRSSSPTTSVKQQIESRLGNNRDGETPSTLNSPVVNNLALNLKSALEQRKLKPPEENRTVAAQGFGSVSARNVSNKIVPEENPGTWPKPSANKFPRPTLSPDKAFLFSNKNPAAAEENAEPETSDPVKPGRPMANLAKQRAMFSGEEQSNGPLKTVTGPTAKPVVISDANPEASVSSVAKPVPVTSIRNKQGTGLPAKLGADSTTKIAESEISTTTKPVTSLKDDPATIKTVKQNASPATKPGSKALCDFPVNGLGNTSTVSKKNAEKPEVPTGASRLKPVEMTQESQKKTASNLHQNESFGKRPLPQLPPDPTIEEDLYSQSWYHSSIDRNDAKAKVKAIGKDGAFLVRKREKDDDDTPYALTLFYANKDFNLLIRRRADQTFALGTEKLDERVFSTVSELISYHMDHTIEVVSNPPGQVKLKIFPQL